MAGTSSIGIRYIKSGSKDARITVGDPTTSWSMASGWATAGEFSIIQEGTAERLHINSSGNVGIGTTNPTYPFVVTATNSATSGWGPTVQYYTGVYPASTSTGTHIGVYNGIGNAGSTTNFSSANIWGAQNEANHGATTTLGTLIASVNDANNTASGNITAAYGSQAYINNSGSGTITNAYGLYARISNTSTISSAYGVYVDAIEGSNKWSFYAADASARNYFAGAVGHQYRHALDSNLARFDRSISDEFHAGASFSAWASKRQRL